MPNDYYPMVNFHFSVTFMDIQDIPRKSKRKIPEPAINFSKNKHHLDMKFQSVSGLDVTLETESIKEGGVNNFEHTVPTRTKYSDLVLKRGKVLEKQSEVVRWCKRTLEQAIYEPKDLLVELLDENHNILMKWSVRHAFPKSWKMGELNAEKGEALIEILELGYNYFTFEEA